MLLYYKDHAGFGVNGRGSCTLRLIYFLSETVKRYLIMNAWYWSVQLKCNTREKCNLAIPKYLAA